MERMRGAEVKMTDALREKLSEELADLVGKMGYPRDFGMALAKQLGTENAMRRMIGYLHSAKPGSAEEIADEMLAICADRDRWRSKKEAEYYNSRYNELLTYGLEGEKDDRDEGKEDF